MGSKTIVTEAGPCQLCPNAEAEFDFRLPGDGRWARACGACFADRRGRLGTGLGQKLIVRAPDPAHPDDLMRMASVLNYKAARVNISVCESCQEPWTEMGASEEEASQAAREMGLDSPDHLCESLDDPHLMCACSCSRPI